MAKTAKCLLIGSIEAYSGKSGVILGIAHQMKKKGLTVAYAKPLGTFLQESNSQVREEDVQFIAQILELSAKQVRSPLVYLDSKIVNQRLQRNDPTDYFASLPTYVQEVEADVILLEAPGTLWEGSLFDLSTAQIAEALASSILLVTRATSALVVDSLLKAKRDLGDRLLGVLINDIPSEQIEEMSSLVKPFLEAEGIPVLGILPRSRLLRSISVRQIAQQLNANVLCRRDRLDLMVENLTIGAMNVNSALEYFRRAKNKAVVTGGGRTDLQLAALETSTSCLILTGHTPPQPLIISRAEDLEVPILSVDLDTLSTVEIVDQAFGKVRIQEQIKVRCIQEMMVESFDIDRLLTQLSLNLV